jgi:hypothetical protein
MKQFQYRIISTGPWKDWFVGKSVDSQWQWKIVTKDLDWKDATTQWQMRSIDKETA